MKIEKRDFAARAAATAGAAALALTLSLGAASAQDKIYTMKISLPTLNDPSYFFAKSYAAALEKDSGGRIKPEIYPASQLGAIPRQIEGTQFGAIQCAIIPPEFFVGVDERFELMAAPGLVDSMDHGQRLAADPEVKKLMFGLGADKGLRGVAMFMNAPSSVIAKNADPPRRRLQGQEDTRARLEISDGADRAARRDAGGDDARRRRAGVAAGRGRRRRRRHRGVDADALSTTRRNTSPRPASRRSSPSPRSASPGTIRCLRTCRSSSTATPPRARPRSARPQTTSSPSPARAGPMPAAN